ncbi:MAG: tetratricopeptide repeat protein [Alphaproteobacteria bacterium]|nr:tetratricopeptide repeat protein [Alphaproteobacteria bacterium]
MMNHVPGRSNALPRFELTMLSRGLRTGALLLVLLPLAACMTAPDDMDDADSSAAGMVRLATQIQAQGDNVGAADFYQRAAQRDPNNATAHKGLASVFEQEGHMAEAADEYRTAIKLKPQDAELRRSLGRVLLSSERAAEARDAYQAALDLDGNDAKSMNGLGIALNNLGDLGGAQKQFEDALKQDPENLTTVNNLAYSYILDGKYGAAIQLLEPHIKNPAATPALRQNLAMAYGLSGMDADAERIARMDLPPRKVKENLAYYKRQRAEMAVTTAPYAELGTYATEALAEAQIANLQAHIDDTGVDLKPVIAPQVANPGGTPRFAVRMMGCAKPDDVDVFCKQLAKNGIPCAVRSAK